MVAALKYATFALSRARQSRNENFKNIQIPISFALSVRFNRKVKRKRADFNRESSLEIRNGNPVRVARWT